MSAGFLTFDIAGTPFAVESDRVEEVAEAVRATPLPFAPPHVEGLANVGGRILPVFDVAGRFASGAAQDGGRRGGPLVVLRTDRGALALRAGRIGETLPEEGVTRADPAPEDAGLPVAARLIHAGRSLRLLDPDRLHLQLDLRLVPDRPTSLAGPVGRQARDVATADPDPDPPAPPRGRAALRLLIVEAGGRAHALDMADVLLVSPVAGLRPLPNAPAPVRGMALIQGRPVLLVDPLGAAPGADGHAVVHATRRGPVGVRVDAVRGVVRFPPDRVTADEAGAPSTVVDHEGKRLEVMSAERLLGDHLDAIGRLIPEGGDPADHRLPRRFYRRFLTILVAGGLYALEFERVRRVVEASGRLRLPRGGEGETGGFDGVTDVDGAILPILDLRRRLTGTPVGGAPADPGVAILLEIGGGMVAVIADSIQRIRRIATTDVDPLSDRLTAAVIRLDGALVPVLRPDGLAGNPGLALSPVARAG